MTEPGPHAMPRLTCLFLLCVVSAAPVASATELIAVRSIDRLEYFRSKPSY